MEDTSYFLYKKEKTREISFPLGGIGTGCIGLGGNGRLIDWEIQNRPNKGSYNGYSHFAIKVEKDDMVADVRVLNADLNPPYTGNYGESHFKSFGFGPPRAFLSGVPHFKEVEFRGEFPIANMSLIDDDFPGKVDMTAFNPFIPLNDKDSSIPAAFFEVNVMNTTMDSLVYTVVLCSGNLNNSNDAYNQYIKKDSVHGIKMGMNNSRKNDVEYGDLTIATDMKDVSYQEYWYRGTWFDELELYWNDLSTPGKLSNRTYKEERYESKTSSENTGDMSTLAVHFSLEPGEVKKARFILSWYYPNCTSYWNNKQEISCKCQNAGKGQWKNYYSKLFEDSFHCAEYALRNWDILYKQTLSFKNTLFSSTLPPVVIDAVSANISILKSPTCLRLEDGSFYGFEGCHCDSGCCEGSCTHVWNYAYALPFLFPKLERSMRELDYSYNMAEDGGMSFRLQLPLGSERSSFRPCADGQFGGILKIYREWKISGDTEWLKRLWPSVKKSIEYAWAESNQDRWDPDRTGVLVGRQHHTLDMELFGPNSWLTGFYLAALKAGAEMADFLGEKETVKEYLEVFTKGKKWIDTNLFNGEYYYHSIDLLDKSILMQFDNGQANTLTGNSTVAAYWNDEKEQIKYQVGEGCIIDQVLAQWHANLIGLGEIFDTKQTHRAIHSLYKNNFKKDMRHFFNPCRVFSLNDEAGMIICSYPKGVQRPFVPVPYAQETMHGFEYQAASHLIQEGFIKEGLEVVKGVRDRYDGEKRNPWNEIECGSNYARSMASYALILSYSGFAYDMSKNLIGFDPIMEGSFFQVFWSLDSGWGVFKRTEQHVELNVLYGYLNLAVLRLTFIKSLQIQSIFLKDQSVTFNKLGDQIEFSNIVKIEEGSSMKIKFL